MVRPPPMAEAALALLRMPQAQALGCDALPQPVAVAQATHATEVVRPRLGELLRLCRALGCKSLGDPPSAWHNYHRCGDRMERPRTPVDPRRPCIVGMHGWAPCRRLASPP